MTTRERLVEAHRAAATFFRHRLESPEGEGPRGYLAGRGLEQSIDDPRWTIGYAPRGWAYLVEHLRERHFAESDILNSGLATTARNGHIIDRFRDRIVLGIHDVEGALVGFSGRAAPGARRDVPRYLNTPSTSIFKKRELLFGLHEQSNRFAAGALPVIVEGQLDVLAVASTTTDFVAVSTCGTALRSEQVMALRASSGGDTVVTAYDDDPAGRKAAMASYGLLSAGFDVVRGASLADGHDPASLSLADPSGLVRALAAADPLADVLVDRSINRFPDHWTNTDARIKALHATARVIAGLLPRDMPRAVARTAVGLGVHHSIVSDDLAREIHEGRIPSTGHAARDLSTARRPELPGAAVRR